MGWWGRGRRRRAWNGGRRRLPEIGQKSWQRKEGMGKGAKKGPAQPTGGTIFPHFPELPPSFPSSIPLPVLRLHFSMKIPSFRAISLLWPHLSPFPPPPSLHPFIGVSAAHGLLPPIGRRFVPTISRWTKMNGEEGGRKRIKRSSGNILERRGWMLANRRWGK